MNRLSTYFYGLSILAVGLIGCDDTELPEEKELGKKQVSEEILDPNRAFNTTFDGKLFSVPSPIQTALLIKSTGLEFNQELLNPEENVKDYTTDAKKALNLGIYGADLGYVTLYEQNAKALNYLNAVESLSNDLGMGGVFDAEFLTRFEENSNDEDSMLVILTDAFRKGDNFLKENERKNVSALILTGGWVESIFFAANLYNESGNEEILTRIGEQKQSLETILEILNEYNVDGENDEILEKLSRLNEVFVDIEMEYIFKNSETDPEDGLTKINSKRNIQLDDNFKEEILEIVNEIRGSITA